ncbi:hypothetical protein J4230_02125 [Candidatus Woesearchaeota archaeon]|nr:hypothetical protein [Candidatus Woesearchaeota archaeon]
MENKVLVLASAIIIIFVLGIVLGISINSKQKIVNEANRTINGLMYKEISIVGLDDKGRGVSAIVAVEVKPGSGLVLVNINDVLADYLTQFSARTASKVASNFTGIALSSLDVVYRIKANASTIEGSSAGAAMTLATIAALANKTINQSVFITGTVDENGTIGIVSGISEKAKAAKERKASLFLIPSASYAVGYDKVKKCKPLENLNYCEVAYVPRKSELSELLKLDIKQVKNITQAANYAII